MGCIILILAGCSRNDAGGQATGETPASDTLTVYVVNYPLQYFAERIGGDHVRVVFPAPNDVDPAFWRPDDETINAYQQADLILLNGASYAKWTRTVTLPLSKVVNTSKSFSGKLIEIAGAVTHSHGPGQDHTHAGIAFTTWLDPALATTQAESIHQAMIQLRPQQEEDFGRGLEDLKSDLKDLDQRLANVFDRYREEPVVFSHPVYQYLTRRFDVSGKSVHWEPDTEPTQAMREELSKLLQSHPAKIFVWESTPIPANAALVDDMGLQSITFDPCGNVPEEGDLISVMRKNIADLENAIQR